MTTDVQTPTPEAATPAAPADRIAEIETVRDTNIDDYFQFPSTVVGKHPRKQNSSS